MSEASNKHVWTEDGRSGEKRVKEVVGNDGSKTIYEELWVEPKQEKRLSTRLTKHIRPVVHTIETELIDEETQEILDRKIESIDHDSKMEIRRHIKSEQTLVAQSTDDCSYVTRDELKDAIVQAVKAVHDSDDCGDYEVEGYSEESINAQSVLEEKYDSSNDSNGGVWTIVLVSACVVLVGGIIGVLTMM
ncbi:MAG: hypothetical protein ACW99G_00425 [Candidatus Thorarchaeota archaeon]|jgi:hypothetical protein